MAPAKDDQPTTSGRGGARMANTRSARGQATASAYVPSWLAPFTRDTGGSEIAHLTAKVRVLSNVVEELSLKDEQHLSINRHLDTAIKSYMDEVAHLKQANATAQARIEELASLYSTEQRDSEARGSHLKHLEATLASKDTEVAQLQSENASLRNQVENQQALLLRKEEERSVLRDGHTALTEELACVKATLEAANKKGDEDAQALGRQVKQQAIDLSKAEQRVANAEGKAAQTAANVAELEGVTEQLENEVVALEEKIAVLKQSHQERESALGEQIQEAHNRNAALEAENEQLRQQLNQQAAVDDDEAALQDSLRRMEQELKETKNAAASWQANEADRAKQLEASELEVAGLKAQLHLLQASSAAPVNGHGKTSNGSNMESLLQQLKEVEAQRDKLDSEADEWAQEYANVSKQAQAAARDLKAAQAEMAALQEWFDEELYQRDCRIQELEGNSSATNASIPPALPQERDVSITAALSDDGPSVSRADMIDGGVQPEFSCDERWNKLREEGATNGWLLHPDTIKKGKELGKGTYGTAYEADFRGAHAVVKCVQVRHANSAEEKKQVDSFRREVETLSHLSHPNILPFFGACMRSYQECWLVTEYLPGGDLSKWLHGTGWRPKRTIGERLTTALGVARGMQAMHESVPAIIHRDLKPSNVFIDAENNARVADMGLARHLLPGDYPTGCTGTVQYMAPEVLDSDAYDLSADVYSFGITLWEICAQQKPYEDLLLTAMQVATRVVDDEEFRPNLKKKMPKDVPSSVAFLCQRCWAAAPELRPPFAEVVETLQDIMKERNFL